MAPRGGFGLVADDLELAAEPSRDTGDKPATSDCDEERVDIGSARLARRFGRDVRGRRPPDRRRMRGEPIAPRQHQLVRRLGALDRARA